MTNNISYRIRVPLNERCLKTWLWEGETDSSFALRIEAYRGLLALFGNNPHSKASQRLEEELSYVIRHGLSDYVLLMKTISDVARDGGIARGSGYPAYCCLMLHYCLGISEINPLDFGLEKECVYREEMTTHYLGGLSLELGGCERLLACLEDRFGKGLFARIPDEDKSLPIGTSLFYVRESELVSHKMDGTDYSAASRDRQFTGQFKGKCCWESYIRRLKKDGHLSDREISKFYYAVSKIWIKKFPEIKTMLFEKGCEGGTSEEELSRLWDSIMKHKAVLPWKAWFIPEYLEQWMTK